jgi:sulfoxide reductase heme-binding subunit YedZ
VSGGAWAVGLGPLAYLGLDFLRSGPWVNPIEALLDWAGVSALTLLVASLAVTPLRRITGLNPLIKARRTIGLFAFFYACAHFLVYLVLDQGLAWSFILEDIAERPYIIAGTSALVLLIPLAVTSTRGWIRRLGRRWARLHRLVYVAAGLAVLHFFWQVKLDTRLPLIYAGVLAALFLARLPVVRRMGSRGPRKGTSPAGTQ